MSTCDREIWVMQSKENRWSDILALILLAGVALLLLARLFYVYLGDVRRFPIHTFKVDANYQHVMKDEISAVLARYDKVSYFYLSTKQLQHDLLALEWVDIAEVNRIWPDVVVIHLIEKRPFLIWNGSLLTEKGQIFSVGHVPSDLKLPTLNVPKNQIEEALLIYPKLSKLVKECGLTLTGITLHENQAWELLFGNGIAVRLGRQAILQRLERFCEVYPTVFASKAEQISHVDLRYAHGMAVQWKQ